MRTATGQEVDIQIFARVQDPGGGGEELASLARRALPLVLALGAGALGVWALWRRRWARACVALALPLVTLALARLLRLTLLTRPDLGEHGYAYNSFPSGHVAVAAACAAAILLLWPTDGALFGAACPLLAGLVVINCVAAVVGHAHRPSDSLGGVLLAASLAAAAAAVTPRFPAEPSTTSR